MENEKTYFKVRSLDQVIEDGRKEKPRRKIIGSFIYENSLVYFYAPPNYGKSLAVFQFAWCAATGKCMEPCDALINNCEPKVTLVADLEMDAQMLFERHEAALKATEPELLKNLIYLHEPVTGNPLFNYDLLLKILEIAIEKKAELIIIDNISKLIPDLLNAEAVTRFIEFLNRMRRETGAAIVIIAHTVKFNPNVAVLPNSFYGSSMISNFFKEIFYLDRTRDGKYFLCHAKTKHREVYSSTVPVFTLGDHPWVGTGFTYEGLKDLNEVQLPLSTVQIKSGRRYALSNYRNELLMMEHSGIKRHVIAEMCDVQRGTVTKILDKAPG